MFGEEIFRIDLVRLYETVGEIADRSCNDFDPHTADLSDWLIANEIVNVNDVEKIPPIRGQKFYPILPIRIRIHNRQDLVPSFRPYSLSPRPTHDRNS